MKHAFIKGFLSSWTVNNQFFNLDQIKISDFAPRLIVLCKYLYYLLREHDTWVGVPFCVGPESATKDSHVPL